MRLLFTCFLVLPSFVLFGQSLNSKQVETQTTTFFEAKEWNKLIHFGESALTLDFDYFKLRYRLGVAYYKQKLYSDAIRHFEAAYEFNAGDEATQQYLYYAYLLLGDYGKARFFTKKMSVPFRNSLNIRDRLVDYNYSAVGAKISDNQDSIGNTVYLHTAFGSHIKERIGIYQTYTFLERTNNLNTFTQHDYAIQLNAYLGKGYTGYFTYHYLKGDYQAQPAGEDEISFWTDRYWGHAYYLGVSKFFGQFSVLPFVAYGQFSDDLAKYVEVDASFEVDTAYLATNAVLQIGTELSYLAKIKDKTVQFTATAYNQYTDDERRASFQIDAYSQLTSKFGLKLSYYQGTSKDFIEKRGLVINNSSILTPHRYDILTTYKLAKKTTGYLFYRLEPKTGSSSVTDFNYHVLILGVKMKL